MRSWFADKYGITESMKIPEFEKKIRTFFQWILYISLAIGSDDVILPFCKECQCLFLCCQIVAMFNLSTFSLLMTFQTIGYKLLHGRLFDINVRCLCLLFCVTFFRDVYTCKFQIIISDRGFAFWCSKCALQFFISSFLFMSY